VVSYGKGLQSGFLTASLVKTHCSVSAGGTYDNEAHCRGRLTYPRQLLPSSPPHFLSTTQRRKLNQQQACIVAKQARQDEGGHYVCRGTPIYIAGMFRSAFYAFTLVHASFQPWRTVRGLHAVAAASCIVSCELYMQRISGHRGIKYLHGSETGQTGAAVLLSCAPADTDSLL
jgi:hypothetical protein